MLMSKVQNQFWDICWPFREGWHRYMMAPGYYGAGIWRLRSIMAPVYDGFGLLWHRYMTAPVYYGTVIWCLRYIMATVYDGTSDRKYSSIKGRRDHAPSNSWLTTKHASSKYRGLSSPYHHPLKNTVIYFPLKSMIALPVAGLNIAGQSSSVLDSRESYKKRWTASSFYEKHIMEFEPMLVKNKAPLSSVPYLKSAQI